MFPGQEQVPDDYLKAIGDVTVKWNAFEGLLNLCLIKLLGKELTDGRSHAVFARMAFPQKLDVLSAFIGELINLPPSHPLARFRNAVLPQIKEAQSKRNLISHSMWGVEKGVVLISSVSARGALKMKQEPISLEEIQAASEIIKKAGVELFMTVVVGSDDSPLPQTGQ